MRLFIAIELPDPVRRHLTECVGPALSEFNRYLEDRQIESRLAAVAPANLHVTLKFLGEADEPAVAALTNALRTVSVERVEPLRAGHIELLPPRGPVRVVSAGLDGDVGRVVRLQSAVERACADQGFAPERRPFLPHITLARARDPVPHERRDRLRQMVERDLPGPDFATDGFTLFESQLGRGPPTYVPLARFGG